MHISTISLLVKRQFKEHFRMYGIGFLVLIAFLFFMFLIVHQWRDSFSGAVQNGVFIIGLFVGGGVFSNAMFSEFSSPQSGIWLLSIPATHAEKVIASILISVVFFLGVYMILFYITDILYLVFTDNLAADTILNPFKNNFYQFFFIYFLFNGVLLLGSIMFNKYSFIKTLLAGVLLFILLNYGNLIVLRFLIPEATLVSSTPFDSFLFSDQGENIKVVLSKETAIASSIFIKGILPICIWVAVWLQLKDKEI